MKTVKGIFVGVMATALFISACSDDDITTPDPGVTQNDRYFMEMAAYGNMNETDAGALAVTMGRDTAVKVFGAAMVADHQTAYNDLATLATAWTIAIPQGPDSAHVAMKQYLSGLSGYSFDTAYINAQIKDHEATVALFRKEVDSTSQPQLKAYAQKYLPKIEMHLAMADSISAILQP
jgi:putative membrane protein